MDQIRQRGIPTETIWDERHAVGALRNFALLFDYDLIISDSDFVAKASRDTKWFTDIILGAFVRDIQDSKAAIEELLRLLMQRHQELMNAISREGDGFIQIVVSLDLKIIERARLLQEKFSAISELTDFTPELVVEGVKALLEGYRFEEVLIANQDSLKRTFRILNEERYKMELRGLFAKRRAFLKPPLEP